MEGKSIFTAIVVKISKDRGAMFESVEGGFTKG